MVESSMVESDEELEMRPLEKRMVGRVEARAGTPVKLTAEQVAFLEELKGKVLEMEAQHQALKRGPGGSSTTGSSSSDAGLNGSSIADTSSIALPVFHENESFDSRAHKLQQKVAYLEIMNRLYAEKSSASFTDLSS